MGGSRVLGKQERACNIRRTYTQVFYHIVETGHVSRRTVLKYKQLLHTFFDYLLHKKLVVANPVTNIPNLGEKETKRQAQFQTRSEIY